MPAGLGDNEHIADAIRRIVDITHLSPDEVTNVFKSEFTRLAEGARVADYLLLFATRRTLDVLKRTH
jgi:hypothetical protein